jgi:hypothetical protein
MRYSQGTPATTYPSFSRHLLTYAGGQDDATFPELFMSPTALNLAWLASQGSSPWAAPARDWLLNRPLGRGGLKVGSPVQAESDPVTRCNTAVHTP